MAMVQVYCRAYNVKPYLEQCISSVLSQTYSDFEFFLVDNGCTDGSSEIMDAFAARDSRIRLIRFEKNTSIRDTLYGIIQDKAEGYVTIIDSDDWWTPDYLEKLVSFAERNDLDIACTGSYAYQDATGVTSILRNLEQPLILEPSGLAEYFPMYHAFFRTYWAKLYRAEVLPRGNLDKFGGYGSDTLYAFDALSRSRRIGIDSTVLHYYRVRQGSISYDYSWNRFNMDTVLYDDALQFLRGFGAVSPHNRRFLRIVYMNAVLDTVRVISNSKLSPPEKAKEFRRISEHPYTMDAYQNREKIAPNCEEIARLVLKLGLSLKKNEFEDIQAAVQAVLPRCGRCVTADNLPLFYAEAGLMSALLQDDRDTLAAGVLSFIRERQYTKQYDLGSTLQALALDIPLLSGIKSTVFMRSYAELYWLIWQGHTVEALDKMTELLLEERVRREKEIFLELYLNAAAQLEEVSAFIYGNIRMADVCLQQGQKDSCRKILMDLKEMGVEENAEIDRLWRALGAR